MGIRSFWGDIVTKTFRRGSESSLTASDGAGVTLPLLSPDQPPVSRIEIANPESVFSDYFQVGLTVNLPARKADRMLQTSADFYLYKIEKYWENEGLIYRIVNKMMEMIMSSGFEIKADDKGDLKKIQTEMDLVLRRSRMTWRGLCRRTSHDFAKYGNVFIHPDSTTDTNTKIYGLEFFDPLTMSAIVDRATGWLYFWVKRDAIRKRGDIEKQIRNANPYRVQMQLARYFSFIPRIISVASGIRDSKYTPEEMIHIAYLKLHQAVISIPPVYPVLEDILTLRSIEDDINLNSFQYGHPFMHATINRENMDKSDIQNEVRALKDNIKDMEGNGMLVTSDKVKVDLKGVQGAFPDLVSYHKLFVQRIEKGAGMPDLFTGEGSGVGRQTSGTVEKSVFGMLSDMGQTIAEGLNELVTQVWNRNIRGAGLDEANASAPVKVVFADPDQNQLRANQQHAIMLFQGGAINHGEYRSMIGEHIDEKWAKKYYFEIQADMGEIAAAANAAAKVKSQQTATNQHGSKTQGGTKKD